MASLRGGTPLWVPPTSVANNAVSPLVVIGPGPYVAIYLKNAHASVDCTFKVQVSASSLPAAGKNSIDSSQSPDGGLDWYDLLDRRTGTVISLTSTHGTAVAYDLSPFAPPYIRLVRTDATGANNGLTALVSAFGVN